VICDWLQYDRFVMPVWRKLSDSSAVLMLSLTYNQRQPTSSHRLKTLCLVDSFTNLQR